MSSLKSYTLHFGTWLFTWKIDGFAVKKASLWGFLHSGNLVLSNLHGTALSPTWNWFLKKNTYVHMEAAILYQVATVWVLLPCGTKLLLRKFPIVKCPETRIPLVIQSEKFEYANFYCFQVKRNFFLFLEVKWPLQRVLLSRNRAPKLYQVATLCFPL